jgi:hypothetical protein
MQNGSNSPKGSRTTEVNIPWELLNGENLIDQERSILKFNRSMPIRF